MDPRPLTLRQVWWMAAGRIDREIAAHERVMALFGQTMTAEQRVRAHPLRRLEAEQEAGKEVEVAAFNRTFDTLFAGN